MTQTTTTTNFQHQRKNKTKTRKQTLLKCYTAQLIIQSGPLPHLGKIQRAFYNLPERLFR